MPMPSTELSTIERTITIHAPRSRVWRALTTAQEFSKWFSADIKGPFETGKRVDLVSTHPAGKEKVFYLIVERMEPEHTFSWRWRPGSAKADEDGDTLVEFRIADVAGPGDENYTQVTVIETGFDRIDVARRAKAFAENGRGWTMQLESLEQYVSRET